MDSTLQKVLALLATSDEETQCAAAKVIGELHMHGAEVVQALGAAASDPKSAVRCAALESLGKTGRPDALRFVLPHLVSPQLAERNRAISATVALGPDVLPAVVKELADDQPALRSMVLAILQRFPVQHSIDYLLDMLPNMDQQGIDSICEDFARKAPELSEEGRKDVAAKIRKFLNKPTVRRQETTLIAALRMLGALRDEAAHPLYLKLLETDSSSLRVLRHALLGLAKIEIPAKDHPKLWHKVWGMLVADENPALAQAAADIAVRLHVPPSATGELAKLLEHREPAVRQLAIRKLGEAGTGESGEALAKCLDDPDWRLRREAMSGLQHCPNAGEVLLSRFESLADDEVARQASQAILEVRPKLTSAQFKKSLQRAMALKQAGERRADALLAVLSALDGDSFAREVTGLGKELLKKGDYSEAESCLRLLASSGPPNTGVKFLLALSRFKVSNKGLLRAEREANRSLSLFAEMVEAGGLDVAEMLIREKPLLDRSDIYYLGFHFVEQMGKLRQFGADLLKHLAKTSPKSQEGRDARNKLKTSGID